MTVRDRLRALWLRYRSWAIRHHPTVWLLHLHVLLPLWFVGAAGSLLVVRLAPIDDSIDLASVLDGLRVLYLFTFLALIVYTSLVVRRLRLFSEVVRRPIATVVLGLLSCVLVVSTPMLVYHAFQTRTTEQLGWTREEICRDSVATLALIGKCQPGFAEGYLGGPPRTLKLFHRCERDVAAADEAASLARTLDACRRHGYTCRAPVCGEEQTLTLLERFHGRLFAVHELAVRGPWLFRLLDYLLFAASTLCATTVFAALFVRPEVWTRTLRILAASGVVLLFLDQVVGDVPTQLACTIIVVVVLALVALSSAVYLHPRAAKLSALTGAVGLAAAPLVATVSAWRLLGWYGPSHTDSLLDVFLSMREYVEFDVRAIVVRTPSYYTPESGWRYPVNLYLPYILGAWCLLVFLLTLLLVAPGTRRAHALPDDR